LAKVLKIRKEMQITLENKKKTTTYSPLMFSKGRT
jgi:hypothetical protein